MTRAGSKRTIRLCSQISKTDSPFHSYICVNSNKNPLIPSFGLFNYGDLLVGEAIEIIDEAVDLVVKVEP